MIFCVFNGPPESGKSTAAQFLITFLKNKQLSIQQDSFASPMKHFIATMLSEQYHKMKKDEHLAILGGYSVREFLISLSEDYMKFRYGDDIFGRTLYYRTLKNGTPPDFVVIDDSGFVGEFDALGEHTNRYLVRVSRPGKDFSYDSRSYLDHPDWTLSNDGSVEDLRGNVYALSNTLVLIHKGEVRHVRDRQGEDTP